MTIKLTYKFRNRLMEEALELQRVCDDDLIEAMERVTVDLADEFDADPDEVYECLNSVYIYGDNWDD